MAKPLITLYRFLGEGREKMRYFSLLVTDLKKTEVQRVGVISQLKE